MKRFVLIALMLFLPALAVAEKPNPADYTVAIHVHASTLVNSCWSDNKGSDCGMMQRVTAKIDGMPLRQYELERLVDSNVLRVGDYKARVVTDVKPRAEEYTLVYEILFSDGKTGRFAVVGESE
jgi:hypothetical protein